MRENISKKPYLVNLDFTSPEMKRKYSGSKHIDRIKIRIATRIAQLASPNGTETDVETQILRVAMDRVFGNTTRKTS